MNFIKQLIFRTYKFCNEEYVVGIQAVLPCYNKNGTYAIWWRLIKYEGESIINTSSMQGATIYTTDRNHSIYNKEIILITQMNHNNDQYKLKVVLKTPFFCYIFNNTNWNVDYCFLK